MIPLQIRMQRSDTNMVNECTPAQTALQNDLVLESLFIYLNRSDLLSSRVVNKQWQYEATKELRRRKLVIRFSFESQTNQFSRSTACRSICRSLKKCRTPSLLSSFQVEIVALIDLGSAGVGNVFTAVGNQLKHLTLHLNDSMLSFRSISLGTHFQNLLFRQAPNLEFLEIKFDFDPHCEPELQALDVEDHNNCLLLPNLKTFIVRGSPVPTFFADVINAAVNLRSFGGAWSMCIKYLMGAEGRAKIHLLKTISFQDFSPNQWIGLDPELVKSFLTEHKQHLQLETFECAFELDHRTAAHVVRNTRVINQILEISSGSLQKLRIKPAIWYNYYLLVIPRLPKLKEICFDCLLSSDLVLGDGGFFPRGFNINHSFPNVSSIVFLECDVPLFRLFASRMEFAMTEPIRSVRHIIMIAAGQNACSVSPLASDFHPIFPNLESISFANEDNYYKI